FSSTLPYSHFLSLRLQVLSVLEYTLGKALNPFMLENWPFMTEVARRRPVSVAFMPRPLWQQLREKQDCDVESLIHKRKIILSPMERARRQKADDLYNHHYLGIGASDVIMLRHLRNDQNFLNPLSRDSTPQMSKIVSENFTIVRKFMKMMHCRKPLYFTAEKKHDHYLYRIEYQTLRDCFRMLRQMRQLRKERAFERLTDYVEHIMSTKIEVKTTRTLPWKWEFVQEVYNLLALAHVDRCSVPKNIDFLDLKNQGLLYWLPTDRLKDIPQEFGGRNVHADLFRSDGRINRIAQKLERLEQRLLHSRYSIERTYLHFEIARCHFKAARYDKSMTLARKAVRESRICNSIIWRFNATFLICQVHAAFMRYERLKESLVKAKYLAVKLKAPNLIAYLELCDVVNDYQLEQLRKRHSELSLRKKRGR
ncbi:hypothetical protein KR222_001400, partial [Zaprionus bogoriensis]